MHDKAGVQINAYFSCADFKFWETHIDIQEWFTIKLLPEWWFLCVFPSLVPISNWKGISVCQRQPGIMELKSFLLFEF